MSYICASCAESNAKVHRARRRCYVEMGLCQQCGKRPFVAGRVQCRPCLDVLADKARARRRAKRADDRQPGSGCGDPASAIRHR